VYKEDDLCYFIDGYDTTKANWMRFVNPAYSSESQNLIACQYKMQIYFYTVKPIMPNQELLVWYCREFAERLNYPLTGEMMLQKIRQQVSTEVQNGPDSPLEVKESALSPKEYARSQLTPPDGSVRSDEGYHSHGYHDDALTPPEESSDSDYDNNYVLDFSTKSTSAAAAAASSSAIAPCKVLPNPENRSDRKSSCETSEGSASPNTISKSHSNEFRKVKIKMPKAFRANHNNKEESSSSRSIASSL
ncbi:unnamed protein product, partial [Allacma fusca]